MKKRAKKINITQNDLDTFLPTDGLATTGDILLTSSRQGRRAGRAKELANLAGLDPEQVNSEFAFNSPLLSEMAYRAGGGAIGAGLGVLLGARAGVSPEDRNAKMLFGGAGGFLAGALVSSVINRVIRNRKIRQIKQLIANKGTINTPEAKDDIKKTPGILNFGDVAYDRGRDQARQYIDLLSQKIPANIASDKVNPIPEWRNAAEVVGNSAGSALQIGPLGSLGVNIADRMALTDSITQRELNKLKK